MGIMEGVSSAAAAQENDMVGYFSFLELVNGIEKILANTHPGAESQET